MFSSAEEQGEIYENLTELQLDALREVGNIGTGNAATALAQLLNVTVDIEVPAVKIFKLNEVPELFGDPESYVIGVYMKMLGSVTGHLLLAFPFKSAKLLTTILLGNSSPEEVEKMDPESITFDDMELSALKEIGNILSSTFLNAIGQLTQLMMISSVPAIAMDYASAILNTVLVEVSMFSNYVLTITTGMTINNMKIEGHYLYIPTPGSLVKILKALGMG